MKATFELELGWAPVDNSPSGDVGTDLLVWVRDRRWVDPGLLIGAQVKTGPSWFRYPSKGDDPEGWWFRDSDKRYTDYWLRHGLPHLVILHNVENGISYWVHVTADAVRDTGKGSKILVPAANTLDADHLDELLAVAGSGRAQVALEGTAWTGATPASSADRLRFALLVPRLIAPHPNAGQQDELVPSQAVALLLQARLNEYDRYADTLDLVPALPDALQSTDWGWRFVGALGTYILDGDIEPMRARISDAPDAAASAAATVVVASALIERADPYAALVVLDATLAQDDANPVDHAWLALQRARALMERGDIEAARDAAIEVQAARATSADDVTATAITGVAAVILFNTASWEQRDLSDVIAGSDTVAAWWRNQTVSRGVIAVLKRTFEEWAADESITVGAADEANNQLFVAALNAGFLGDQGSWRRFTALLGQDSLLRLGRHSPAEKVAGGLRLLRLAGDEKAMKRAIKRIADDGPTRAVTDTAAEVSLSSSTRTTILADLTLLQAGGDLLERKDAEAAARWILSMLDDPSPFVALTTTHYGDVRAELITRLAGLAGVVPDLAIELVHDRLATVTDDQETLRTQAWRTLLRSIPERAWTAENIADLKGSEALAADVRTVTLGVSAVRQAEAQQELIKQVRAGSLAALAALSSVAKLDAATATAVLDRLRASLDKARQTVRRGKLDFGVHDEAQCAAVLLSFHTHAGATDALLAYLDDRYIPRAAKSKALWALAQNRDRLDGKLRERLAAVAERAGANEGPLDGGFFQDPDIAGPVGFLVATLGDDPALAAQKFSELLSGPGAHRAWAAALAAASGDELLGVLPAMVQDQQPEVRRAAAGLLAQRAAGGTAGPAASAALRSAAADPGRAVPLAIAETFAQSDDALTSGLRRLLTGLKAHPSAKVRASAAEALSR